MELFYCVLKKYSGIFKKKHLGNTHLFIFPVSHTEFFYLSLVGEFIKVKSSYACLLIARRPTEFMLPLIEEQKRKFKGRFEIVERLPCVSKELGQGKYTLTFPKKGRYIKSNLALAFEPEYSDSNDRMYSLYGKIDIFVEDEVTPQTAKMLSLKKIAFLGLRARFKIGG